jgi:hypothetical protein
VNTTQAVCLGIEVMNRQMPGRQPEASRIAAA